MGANERRDKETGQGMARDRRRGDQLQVELGRFYLFAIKNLLPRVIITVYIVLNNITLDITTILCTVLMTTDEVKRYNMVVRWCNDWPAFLCYRCSVSSTPRTT